MHTSEVLGIHIRQSVTEWASVAKVSNVHVLLWEQGAL